jgi:hypothetical protein
MITAAAPAFLPLQPSVTSGARLNPHRLRSGGCTCSNKPKVTIYNCRISQRGIETLMHVHNGVLVKILIWIKLPV